MPFLNRKLGGFETTKSITIQYPVDLRSFRMLPNVARGYKTDFEWSVHNKGSKRIGFENDSDRQVTMSVAIQEDSGRLLRRTVGLEDLNGAQASIIEARDGLPVVQTVQVSPLAQNYSSIVLRVTLSISTPESSPESTMFRKIQCYEVGARVSSRYEYNKESSVLVVTNQTTTREHLMALQYHVQDQLGLGMDIWNIALYGGLQYPDPEDSRSLLDVVSNYENGITIIFLGGSFDFFDLGPHSIIHLSDLSLIGRSYQNSVSCLFLGLLDEQDVRSWTYSTMYPVQAELREMTSHVATSSVFSSKEELLRSLMQMVSHDNTALTAYHLHIDKSKYWSDKRVLRSQANRLASYLNHYLPQERFWICPYELAMPERQGKAGALAIFHGVPLSAQMSITERRKLRGIGGASVSRANLTGTFPQLDSFDFYACIRSLDIRIRLRLIIHPPDASAVASPSDSHFISMATTLSLAQCFDAEINTFLRDSNHTISVSFPTDHLDGDTRPSNVHLPAMTIFFAYLQTTFPEERPLPETILLILRYLLASSSAQKKRQTASRILPPFQTRRSDLFAQLEAKVRKLLFENNHSDTQIQTFFKEWRSWRAKQLSSAGSITRAIVRSLAELLKTSEHIYEKGRMEASDVDFERTRVCTREEWDARATLVQEWRKKVEEDGAKARVKLTEMNGGEEAFNDSIGLQLPTSTVTS